MTVGYVDFDQGIRFDDDAAVGLHLTAGLRSWLTLGIQLDRITARDGIRDTWQDVTVISVRSRIEPWSEPRLALGGLLGVSFMGFEDAPNLDAISEGLDLGPVARLRFANAWLLRGELLLRLQTFRRVRVDEAGLPTGTTEETGYLWSRVWQLGLARAF